VIAVNTFQRGTLVFLSLVVLLACSCFVLAASPPTAPESLSENWASTFDSANYANQSHEAIAGNITQLLLDGISQTRAWQGYFGNISGTITLDDVNNFTFYNWTALEPRGQIYATLGSAGIPSWPDVVCAVHDTDATDFDNFYGIHQDDYDNVTITYPAVNHPDFWIIDRTITGCPTTYIYQNDAAQVANFVNVLMKDTTKGAEKWVFATLIENKDISDKTDRVCYNNEECDFQLLVAEDGHHTDVATTQYNFWVDLIG
jgi:hypothetical protein